jgi:NDP-sugar pyrophosphorylase family protein
MNIIIPLAGSIKITKESHYPLLLHELLGKPLIEYVTDNLKTIKGNNTFYYILNEKDCIKYHLDKTLKLLTPNCEITIIKTPCKGAVCSILMAVDKINLSEETIIVNSDQIFNKDLNSIHSFFTKNDCDGGVITFSSVHPRWSYILCDDNNNVLQAVEKNPISKNAIAGFYYFKTFKLFLDCSFNSIEIEDFQENKLYTSALINQLVLLNKKVMNFSIDKEDYKSFFTIQKINEFEKNLIK